MAPLVWRNLAQGNKTQTKINSGGIETEKLVLEAKLLLFAGAFAAAEVQQMEEEVLKKLVGTMGIGIGQSTLGGSGT